MSRQNEYKVVSKPNEQMAEMLKRTALKILKPKFRNPKPPVTQIQEKKIKEWMS